MWEHGWAITTKLRERQRQATLQIRRGQAVAQLTGVGWGPIAGSLGFVLLLLAGVVGGEAGGGECQLHFMGAGKTAKGAVNVTQNSQCGSRKLSVREKPETWILRKIFLK